MYKDTGSLAIASDMYRYRVQREGLDLDVNCDVYCLMSFFNNEYTLAIESNTWSNSAI